MINITAKLIKTPKYILLVAKYDIIPKNTLNPIRTNAFLAAFKVKSFSKNIKAPVTVVTAISVFSSPNIFINVVINSIININRTVFDNIVFLFIIKSSLKNVQKQSYNSIFIISTTY